MSRGFLTRCLVFVLVVLAWLAGPCRGEDSERPRFYVDLRGGESNPLVRAHDLVGLSVGANFNRYLGAELSADFYETRLDIDGYGHIGEYGIVALIPQLRLRYPFLGGRLVPYVVGGVGVALPEFNDRKPRGFGLSVDSDSAAIAGTIGGGIEYYVADNVAIGLEGKYLMAADPTVRVNGSRHDVDIDTGMITLGYRVLYPELRPHSLEEARIAEATRVFLGVRAGGAIPVKDRPFSGLEARPEPPAYGGQVDQLFGISVGVNVGRYWGAELAFDGYEMVLAEAGVGSLTEYAVYTLIPAVRLRYPLLAGRLEPYVLAGVGASYAEDNDVKPAGANLDIKATNWAVAGSLGAGIEYFVVSNVALGLDVRYLISRGHTIQIDGGNKRTGNLDTVMLALTFRTFLWQSSNR